MNKCNEKNETQLCECGELADGVRGNDTLICDDCAYDAGLYLCPTCETYQDVMPDVDIPCLECNISKADAYMDAAKERW